MDEKKMMAVVEAILFAAGEAVTLKDISDILEIKLSTAAKLMDKMIESFTNEERGVQILKANDTFRLATSPSCAEYINRLMGRNHEKKLSAACLETLSVIAYRQPVTRMDIENIRGVRCEHSLSVLLEKGIIREVGRMEAIGRPILYGTTEHFLRSFGLTSLKDLPALDEQG